MCAGAIVQSRIGRVVYGADDPKAGPATASTAWPRPRLNHRAEVRRGPGQECGEMLTEFFQARRPTSEPSDEPWRGA